jgi:two-component system, OmpR family, response regulator
MDCLETPQPRLLSVSAFSQPGFMMLASPKRLDRVRVLLVDDAPDIATLMKTTLESEGFLVEVAEDGERALERFAEVNPTVVILDLGLPGIDGFETCRRLREISDVHVIILTARGEEVDKLVGFTIGADDYVTKPVSMRELAARIRAVARRQAALVASLVPATHTTDGAVASTLPGVRADRQPEIAPPLSVDAVARTVVVGTNSVQLTRTEFALFRELADHTTDVVSRAQLQAVVWGPDWRGGSHLVEVHMSNLRRKLANAGAGWLIQTIREAGYRLRTAVAIA